MTGTIPAYAAGTLYRTGPGSYQVETHKGNTFSTSHWFDGFTQVHRFQIIVPPESPSAVRVLYNSKTNVDALIEQIRRTGDLNGFCFGQKRDPCESYFKKMTSLFVPAVTSLLGLDSKDESLSNTGVTVSPNFPGLESSRPTDTLQTPQLKSLWLKSDTKTLKEIDPETLEPIGIADQKKLHPSLSGPLAAAHAKTDPVTGDVFNYNLNFGRAVVYRVFCVSASTGKTSILAKITDAEAAYVHSLFLTENHVILCVWNSHIAAGGLKMLYTRNLLDAISPLDPNARPKWYVIDRRHDKGVIATYNSDAFFCFHTVNAWEERSNDQDGKTDIIADMTIYDNLDIVKRFYYENMKGTSPGSRDYIGVKGDSSRPRLTRWRLPDVLASDPASREAICEWEAPKTYSPELPTVNPKTITAPHRYVYGVTDSGQSTFFDSLVRVDMESRREMIWREHGQTPGEAIFVPDPQGKDELDGVLLSVVLDGNAGRSYLLCLDPKTMKEMGRASLEKAVGFGFHGNHLPTKGAMVTAY